MARTNYSYEKRQRELAKKKKKEEKRLKKARGEQPEGEAVDGEQAETSDDGAAPANAGDSDQAAP